MRKESEVVRTITRVMARPMSASATGRPIAMTAAEAITASATRPCAMPARHSSSPARAFDRAVLPRLAQDDDRRPEVALALRHPVGRFDQEAEPRSLGRDLLRRHAVEPHHDILGMPAPAGPEDLAATLDRCAPAVGDDRHQLARVVHPGDVARVW